MSTNKHKQPLRLQYLSHDILDPIFDLLLPVAKQPKQFISQLIQDVLPFALTCRSLLQYTISRLSSYMPFILSQDTLLPIAPECKKHINTLYTISKILHNQRLIYLNSVRTNYQYFSSQQLPSWNEVPVFPDFAIPTLRSTKEDDFNSTEGDSPQHDKEQDQNDENTNHQSYDGYNIRHAWLQIALAANQYRHLDTRHFFVMTLLGKQFHNLYYQELVFCTNYLPTLTSIFLADIKTTNQIEFEKHLLTLLKNNSNTLQKLSISQGDNQMMTILQKVHLPNLKHLHLRQSEMFKRPFDLFDSQDNSQHTDVENDDSNQKDDDNTACVENVLQSLLSHDTRLTTLTIGFKTLHGGPINMNEEQDSNELRESLNLALHAPYVHTLILEDTFIANANVLRDAFNYCENIERIQFTNGNFSLDELIAYISGQYVYPNPSLSSTSTEQINEVASPIENANRTQSIKSVQTNNHKKTALPKLEGISFNTLQSIEIKKTPIEMNQVRAKNAIEKVEEICLKVTDDDSEKNLSSKEIKYIRKNCRNLKRFHIQLAPDGIPELCKLLRKTSTLTEIAITIPHSDDDDDSDSHSVHTHNSEQLSINQEDNNDQSNTVDQDGSEVQAVDEEISAIEIFAEPEISDIQSFDNENSQSQLDIQHNSEHQSATSESQPDNSETQSTNTSNSNSQAANEHNSEVESTNEDQPETQSEHNSDTNSVHSYNSASDIVDFHSQELVNALLATPSDLQILILRGCMTPIEDALKLLCKMGRDARVFRVPLLLTDTNARRRRKHQLKLCDAERIVETMIEHCPNIEDMTCKPMITGADVSAKIPCSDHLDELLRKAARKNRKFKPSSFYDDGFSWTSFIKPEAFYENE